MLRTNKTIHSPIVRRGSPGEDFTFDMSTLMSETLILSQMNIFKTGQRGRRSYGLDRVVLDYFMYIFPR